MHTSIKSLENAVTKHIATLYFISGDIPLLAQNARDCIKAAAKKQGYLNYQLFHVTAQFKWEDFHTELQAYSLFSEKTILDLRNPTAKFDKTSTKIITEYCENPDPSKVIIISSNKLTAAQKRSSWYKIIEKNGVIIQFWPMNQRDLHQWISQQLNKAELRVNHEGIRIIAELTEGNLLASQQAIEKLKLLYPKQSLTDEMITQTVSDNAQFSVFDLTNYILQGDTQHIAHIMQHLQFSGAEPTLVLWSLCNELRQLIKLCYKLENGDDMQQVLAGQWASRKTILKNTLQRVSTSMLETLLLRASKIDLMIKGISPGNHWDALTQLAFSFAGTPTRLQSSCR